jgi:hypothetical protein
VKIILGAIAIFVLIALVFGLLIVGGLIKGAKKFIGKGHGGFPPGSYGHHHYKHRKHSSMSFFSS